MRPSERSRGPKAPARAATLFKWWHEQLEALPAPARFLVNAAVFLWSAALAALLIHYLLCLTGVLPAAADFDLG